MISLAVMWFVFVYGRDMRGLPQPCAHNPSLASRNLPRVRIPLLCSNSLSPWVPLDLWFAYFSVTGKTNYKTYHMIRLILGFSFLWTTGIAAAEAGISLTHFRECLHIPASLYHHPMRWSVSCHTLGKPPSTTTVSYCEHPEITLSVSNACLQQSVLGTIRRLEGGYILWTSSFGSLSALEKEKWKIFLHLESFPNNVKVTHGCRGRAKHGWGLSY